MNKTKSKYSLGSNIMYSLAMYWKAKKSTLIFCGINILMGVSLPFVGILLPKLVIDELAAGVTPAHFSAVVGGVSAILIILNYLKSYTDEIANHSVGSIAIFNIPVRAMVKRMTMDYELMEDPDVKVLEDKASRAGRSNHSPAHNIPRTLVRLTTNILGFLLYGSVITSIHPVILILLVLSAVINWFCLSAARKYEKATREERSLLHKKLRYVYSSIKTPDKAKDIRLYSMSGWIKELFKSIVGSTEHAEGKVATKNMLAQLADGFLILIRDGAAYAFLIYLLLQDKITLGDFVFVFAAIGAFAGWVSGIILQASELSRASSEMSDIRQYLDVPDKSNTGLGVQLPSGEMLPPGISLKGVGYTYPKAETEALSDINLDIKPGERIAIVGANGAGKTTLVKLICGLYRPKKGSISVGGVEIDKYNRDEYFTLFSTVFQDIHLLTCDIAGNVSQTLPEMTDYKKVEECLHLSGLYTKVQAMPDKEKTLLVREVNDDAVELSGGEKQKLALARALYKDAPIIILDEPTAALDPIAENEVYQKYAELTSGKTSIYISHRLASTRFCDRILFIDNHVISEAGTHDELMKLGGKYAGMFEIQSHYYKNGEEAAVTV
jgi:ABC-type multidrug transport system fused ATPase/permease subunit